MAIPSLKKIPLPWAFLIGSSQNKINQALHSLKIEIL